MKIHLMGEDQSTACGTRSTATTIYAVEEFVCCEAVRLKYGSDLCLSCLRIARKRVVAAPSHEDRKRDVEWDQEYADRGAEGFPEDFG